MDLVLNDFMQVRDDTEYAAGDVIPLWAFGLLY